MSLPLTIFLVCASSTSAVNQATIAHERSLQQEWEGTLNGAHAGHMDTPVTRVVNLLKEMQQTMKAFAMEMEKAGIQSEMMGDAFDMMEDPSAAADAEDVYKPLKRGSPTPLYYPLSLYILAHSQTHLSQPW